jgi:hypothetical protein
MVIIVERRRVGNPDRSEVGQQRRIGYGKFLHSDAGLLAVADQDGVLAGSTGL